MYAVICFIQSSFPIFDVIHLVQKFQKIVFSNFLQSFLQSYYFSIIAFDSKETNLVRSCL
jgi:hypothetical protein